jgi:hypothetical protein
MEWGLNHTSHPFFSGYLGYRVLLTICSGLSLAVTLLIADSHVSRIYRREPSVSSKGLKKKKKEEENSKINNQTFYFESRKSRSK